jgi:nitrogen fixation protein
MTRGARKERLTPVESLVPLVVPQFADRAKLERAAAEWSRIAGALPGKASAPVDISEGELLVVAESPLVADRISMMGGNIMRALAEGWKLEVRKVRVVVGRLPLKGAVASRTTRPPVVSVREEDVRELRFRCERASLPGDAAESLARLRAFFAVRFRK